eukprot:45971_1
MVSFQLFVATFISVSYSRPNVVLLFPDEWRFDWADQYYITNLSLNTPTFNSICTNGTRFINTCVGSPLCAPSRSCIGAGKEYDYTYVPTNNYDFPLNSTTIYKLMQDNGYWVMVSGKDDLTKKSGCGINGTYRQNELGYSDQRRCLGKMAEDHKYPNPADPFSIYLSQHYNINTNGINVTEWNITYECDMNCCKDEACPKSINVHTESYEDNWITERTLEMMDNIPQNKPWFLQINWAGPHRPFIILESMNKTINNRTYSYPMGNCTANKDDMMITRRDYSAEIENLDSAFSIIINKVRELGQFDNTIFCVSSDHGEMLGDYNAWAESKPWVASVNVPLVCMGPNIKKNEIINTYVTNMDLAGTFLDFTETQIPKSLNMTTRSLRSFLNGTWNDNNNEYRKYVSSGINNWRMVVQQINHTTIWKYVCCHSQCPGRQFNEKYGLVQLLFNIIGDTYEQNNVIKLYPDIGEQMKTLLPPKFCVPGNYSAYWSDMTQYE